MRGPRTAEVELLPPRRGVLESVAVELASCAPLGLLWWAREVEVACPGRCTWPRGPDARQVEVGRDDPPGRCARAAPGGDRRATRRAALRLGRPETAGALAGDLACGHAHGPRERAPTRRPGDTQLVLSREPDRADAEAEEAMAQLSEVLEAGREVLLGTDGRAVPYCDGYVTGSTSAGASRGPAPTPPRRARRRSADHPGGGRR